MLIYINIKIILFLFLYGGESDRLSSVKNVVLTFLKGSD